MKILILLTIAIIFGSCAGRGDEVVVPIDPDNGFPSGRLQIVYPLDRTLFPPDIAPPTIL